MFAARLLRQAADVLKGLPNSTGAKGENRDREGILCFLCYLLFNPFVR